MVTGTQLDFAEKAAFSIFRIILLLTFCYSLLDLACWRCNFRSCISINHVVAKIQHYSSLFSYSRIARSRYFGVWSLARFEKGTHFDLVDQSWRFEGRRIGGGGGGWRRPGTTARRSIPRAYTSVLAIRGVVERLLGVRTVETRTPVIFIFHHL